MGAEQQGADATQNRWLVIPRTLCFVVNGDDVLLMKRSPNRRVFPNQYNGLGGHIERNEDPLSGARREIREESGLEVDDLTLRSVHNIDAGADTGILLLVYTARATSRDFNKTGDDEGTLEWVPIDRLDEYDLVEDLPIILSKLFSPKKENQPLSAHVSYDDNDDIQVRFAQNGESE